MEQQIIGPDPTAKYIVGVDPGKPGSEMEAMFVNPGFLDVKRSYATKMPKFSVRCVDENHPDVGTCTVTWDDGSTLKMSTADAAELFGSPVL